MHKVSNGRPWPAIRFLILFRCIGSAAEHKGNYRVGGSLTRTALWLLAIGIFDKAAGAHQNRSG